MFVARDRQHRHTRAVEESISPAELELLRAETERLGFEVLVAPDATAVGSADGNDGSHAIIAS